MQKTIDSERLTKAGGLNFADKNLSLVNEWGYSHIYNRLAKLEDMLDDGELVSKDWHDEQVLQLASENEVLKSERDNLERTLEETGEELKDAQAEIERKTGVIRLLEKDVAALHKEREKRVEEVYEDFMRDYKIVCDEAKELTERVEDLEKRIEHGTLLELPCTIGSVVYHAVTAFRKSGDASTAYYYALTGKASWQNMPYIIKEWGKRVFATREDALERCAELEDGANEK